MNSITSHCCLVIKTLVASARGCRFKSHRGKKSFSAILIFIQRLFFNFIISPLFDLSDADMTVSMYWFAIFDFLSILGVDLTLMLHSTNWVLHALTLRSFREEATRNLCFCCRRFCCCHQPEGKWPARRVVDSTVLEARFWECNKSRKPSRSQGWRHGVEKCDFWFVL